MLLQNLKPYIWRHRLLLFGGIVTTIAGVSAAMVPPHLAKLIIDDIFKPASKSGNFNGHMGYLLLLIVLISTLTIVRALCILGKTLLLETFSQRILRDLRKDLYDHIQELSFDFFNRTRTGELMSRMTSDMEALRNVLVMGIMSGATGIFYALLSSILLLLINWRLALISIAASPFLFLTTLHLRKLAKPCFQRIRQALSTLNTTVQENISGIRVVQSFVREQHELRKFQKDNHGLSESRNNALRVWANHMPVVEFLTGLPSALILLFGGWMVIKDSLTIGEWVQFNGYIWMIVFPMRMLAEMVNQYSLADAAAERVFEVMHTKPNIVSPEPPSPVTCLHGDVKLNHVYWETDGQTVLKDINIHAPTGSTVAIMGATGSGKSSLVHLITRFYDATSGRILIDDIPIEDLDLNTLRHHVGLVAQETFLFSETMYNNLTYGCKHAPIEFVHRVTSQTQAHMFIDSMAEGYDTVVGERGVGLSGGQKQRASIARTLLKQAPILILDDATSAVDMETESLIQGAIQNLEHRVTTFIIAHRISSVKHANEIIILDHGEIIERGTHRELLQLGGEYSRVYRIQTQSVEGGV